MNIPNQLGNLRPTLTAGWRRIADSAAAQSRSTLPWRNGLFVLFLTGILTYGVFFAGYLLVSFDLLNLIRDVNNDDAFYYFQIARNLAAGQFSTFDGGITQTNGYHPLWMLLITPFYWVMDAETALFGIKGFEIILIAGAVLLIVAAARLTGQLWLLLFALLPPLYGNFILFHGLEAAAALFMLGLLFPALALYARNPARGQWPLAIVAFLLPWARLEYIAISLTATAAIGALAAWRPEPPDDSGAAGAAAWRSRLTPAVVTPFLGAVAGILIYFAYNWLVFDGWAPVSGATRYSWSQYVWDLQGGYNLFRNFGDVLQIPVFGYELLVALEVCVYAPLVWWLARRAESRQDWLLLAFLIGVFSLGVGHIAKFVQTGLAAHPGYGSYTWYFVPAYLLAALIIPVRCFVALYLIRRHIGSRWPWTARLLSVGVVVIGAVSLLTTTKFDTPFHRVDRLAAETTTAEHETSSYMGTWALNRILPEGSVIGSWDAGVIGYFSRFPVVNLDGVVNTWDYWRATGGRGRAWDRASNPFYEKFGITHLANHTARAYDNVLFTGPSQGSPGQGAERFVLAAVEPPAAGTDRRDYQDQLWERIAPHFNRQEGDVGLAVYGPVALAIARHCAPEEIIVWSWSVPGAKPVFQPGTNTGHGPGGMCVSNAMLPTAAPAVAARVETMPAREYLTQLRVKSLPALRDRYDVYRTENSLIYTREECNAVDRSRFLLHLYPADAAYVPEWQRPHDFDNRDFEFRQYGTLADGICLVNAPLPDYAITRIHTGQYAAAGSGLTNLWGEVIPTDLSFDEMLARVDLRKAALPPRDYLAMLTADREPLIRSNYDVYRVDDRLIYVREQCRPEAAPATFFLHLYPRDPANLPEALKMSGFDNRDFEFQQYGVQADGMCLANVPLPPHDIVRIRTGQFVIVGGDFSNLWEETWDSGEPP